MSERERRTVLVVDDDRGPRESLRIILSPAFDVLLAESGAEALEILRTVPVDLLTLDLNMPGIQGDELMRTVRREFPDTEVVIITGYGSVESASEALRYGISDYLQKPFDVVQVTAAVTRALARQDGRRHMVRFLDDLGSAVGRETEVQTILADIGVSPALKRRIDTLLRDASEAARARPGASERRTVDLLELLAETLEAADPYMRGHGRRTACYAGLLAERLCLSAAQQERVRLAAFLHDVGKLSVPSELLSKPGPLDAAERVALRCHPAVGARLIEPLGLSTDVAAAIRHHHEWWNGSGYPDGVKYEEIPLAARIVQIADAFDAMTCDRPYRPALDHPRVLEELRLGAGTQFDPDLAKEFLVIVETRTHDVEVELLADLMSVPPTRSQEPVVTAALEPLGSALPFGLVGAAVYAEGEGK